MGAKKFHSAKPRRRGIRRGDGGWKVDGGGTDFFHHFGKFR
jgi:hypothetical protein